ncbi:hypothetical protein EDM54_02440 [Brevibacillus borstelensis]|uniref:hypothetical protein n=1 Tax=Brevibacillus borstelensis TaxID=45462 RepID=UPI000F0890B3|nr:hypothetical protein [Brevibacillus borstelensis]MED1881243.1 hypothetical protein [Brevibacillus borstelensis]RNB66110.1 hypothetical protein EDM54_02440 [Brevibacillus borstelensis]GED55437.1 hypothetical protein BBO01nite_46780 [Brevibacillus borstelensis]
MTAVYTICTVNQFHYKEEYVSPTQIRIPDVEEAPESNYKLVDPEYLMLKFDQHGEPITIDGYKAHQDLVIKKYGRVFGKEFHSFLVPQDFYMYFVKELNILLVNAGKDTVKAFLERMKEDSQSGFKAETFEVDFNTVMQLIPVISGAWVAEIKKPNLRSAGFFGKSVDKNEEFKAAAQAGVVSSLMFEYSSSCWPYSLKIAITRNGGIVFYTRAIDPKSRKIFIDKEIEIATELFLKYIKK